MEDMLGEIQIGILLFQKEFSWQFFPSSKTNSEKKGILRHTLSLRATSGDITVGTKCLDFILILTYWEWKINYYFFLKLQ